MGDRHPLDPWSIGLFGSHNLWGNDDADKTNGRPAKSNGTSPVITKSSRENLANVRAQGFGLSFGSQSGSQDANWIEAGSVHELRLYNVDHSELLEKVLVTKPTP